MAGKYDITIEQGATFCLPITVYYSDNTAYNLTSWTPRGQVRRTRRSTTIVASFTCTKTDPTNGKFEISMIDDVTGAIPCGESVTDSRSKYVYDVEMENTGTGEVKRLLEGSCYVSPEVTRAT